jgi:membrane protease YdiL (CAAX protease family)
LNDWQEFLLSLLAYLIIGGIGIVVAAAALTAAPYFWRRPFPLPRLRPGRWSGREVFATLMTPLIALYVVSGVLVPFADLPKPDGTNEAAVREAEERLLFLSNPVANVLTVALVITLLFATSRTRPQHLGLTWARWPANVVLGAGVFLTITVPVLAIHVVATWLTGSGRHLLERLAHEGFVWWEWVVLFLMTVCGAPVVEEMLFRGVLQGWLRRASLVGHGVLVASVVALPLLPPFRPRDTTVMDAIPLLAFGGLLAAGYIIALRQLWWRAHEIASPPTPTAAEDATDAYSRRPDDPRRQLEWSAARLGVYGSSMLWAMVHGNFWPAPIPLFLLGLGLGWLALRTQSLIGPMVCHALFNSVACLALWWSV